MQAGLVFSVYEYDEAVFPETGIYSKATQEDVVPTYSGAKWRSICQEHFYFTIGLDASDRYRELQINVTATKNDKVGS